MAATSHHGSEGWLHDVLAGGAPRAGRRTTDTVRIRGLLPVSVLLVSKKSAGPRTEDGE